MKPTRGATILRQILMRRASGEKTPVVVGVVTNITSGPNAYIFISYLRVLTHDKISILTPTFVHVSEVDQNMIWHDLLVN